MFHVVGNIEPVAQITDGPSSLYRFSVTCHDENGLPAFRSAASPEVFNYVFKWCGGNLSHPYQIGGYESVLFSREEDALLFYMTFK